MKKYIDLFSRYFIGILFIFSGLIKLNDPIGTEIKMEEYFEVFAQNFSEAFLYLKPISLEISMILIVLEIVLGFAVLVHYQMNITATLILILLVFFTFLTGYSHFTNAVTDCGCFGDAIKLTPKQSFIKDLVLLVFVLHLFWYRKGYKPVFYTRSGHIFIAAITIISTAIGIYAINHLPYIDFRAYRIGNHIPDQMKPQEQAIFEYVFTRKDNGKEERSSKYLTDTTLYVYKSAIQVNPEKTKAKITDYAVSSVEGEDYTAETFTGAKLIFVIYDVSKASTKNTDKIRDLIATLDGKIEMLALTSSGADEFEQFRHENQLAIPFYFADATVLKTIIRSNPGITLWVDGTVKGMWHHNDTPSAEEILTLSK
jgi:uncharacterized membrane protein YphA (DoxX/SURF4 family)